MNTCPFCGDNNAIAEPYYDESAVRCQKCGATGPTGNYKECQKLWDKRAGDAPCSDDIDAMINAIAADWQVPANMLTGNAIDSDSEDVERFTKVFRASQSTINRKLKAILSKIPSITAEDEEELKQAGTSIGEIEFTSKQDNTK